MDSKSLYDGLRAVRAVRYHAKEWNIDPDKIAIGGFSAGGMVSGRVGTMFDKGNPGAEDPVEYVLSRPDAVVLVYGHLPSILSVQRVTTEAILPFVWRDGVLRGVYHPGIP